MKGGKCQGRFPEKAEFQLREIKQGGYDLLMDVDNDQVLALKRERGK